VSERFYTSENVLDLMRTVFPFKVLSNNEGQYICQMAFTGDDGKWMTLSNMLQDKDSKYDIYDGMYCLLKQAAQVRLGGIDKAQNIHIAKEGDDPIEALCSIVKEIRVKNE